MIEISGVGKVFGDGTPALREVGFDVPTGTVCALLGHNGAGKTTLVKILSTLVRPDSGTAVVAGHDVVRRPDLVRRNIGVTGQEAALDPFLTGRENLELFGRLRGLRTKQSRSRAGELIDQFDMGQAADRRVDTYSGGMARRIDIAGALVVPPRVLFLDEPTTGLDPRSRRDVWALVASLSAQDVTVLLTTQYLEEADVLSDNVVILESGRVIASGTSEELKRKAGSTFCEVRTVKPEDVARLSEALSDFGVVEPNAEANTVSVPAAEGAASLAEVLRRVDRLGIELIDISLRKPTLDEVFLNLCPAAVHA